LSLYSGIQKVREKKHLTYLADQVYPEVILGLYDAYLDATQEPYGHLFLNLTPNKKDDLKFRTHIFPNDKPPYTVYSYVGDQASEDELLHHAGAEDSRPEIA